MVTPDELVRFEEKYVMDVLHDLRALTCWRPWPSAIFAKHPNAKRVENRGKPPPRHLLGAHIAIHAGQHADHGEWPWPADVGTWVPRDGGPVGIRGVVRILGALDCRNGQRIAHFRDEDITRKNRLVERLYGLDSDPWWAGPVGILLDDVVAIEPVPCKGAMGYWRVPDSVREVVFERWTEVRR